MEIDVFQYIHIYILWYLQASWLNHELLALSVESKLAPRQKYMYIWAMYQD